MFSFKQLSICPNCSDVQASLQISWVDDINFHLLLMNPWFPSFGPMFLKMLFKGPIIFALIFPCLPFISRFYVRTFLEVIWTFLILEVWIPFDRDSNFFCILTGKFFYMYFACILYFECCVFVFKRSTSVFVGGEAAGVENHPGSCALGGQRVK